MRSVGLLLAAGWLVHTIASAAPTTAEPMLAAAPGGPPLPPGLKGPTQKEPTTKGPALPPGLKDAPKTAPALPPGLKKPAPDRTRPEPKAARSLPFQLSGFLDVRGGRRVREDPYHREGSLAESRLQLEIEKRIRGIVLRATTDLLYDALADKHAIDLETGDGFIDLREASAAFSPATFIDVKLGRQILTWGTGDLIFINDLFPKDWNSFLLGRDVEYLKAPSDALKLSAFSKWANLDVVYTPAFDADRFVDGRRLSFFNPAFGRITGRDAVVRADRPDRWFRDDEWAVRLYRNFGAYEGALYGYDGFWKSPAGTDTASGRATFPRLSVFGSSLRGPLGKGIANLELGLYLSREDLDGDDPTVRNSEFRLLLGYEQEIAKDLTLGLQYNLERMLGYRDYLRTLPAGSPPRDENRHVLTLRLTWLTMKQNLTSSLFVFFSPSDMDAYLRLKVRYKVDDNLSVEAGSNIFVGRDDHTFFGQFGRNTNIYAGVRYSF